MGKIRLPHNVEEVCLFVHILPELSRAPGLAFDTKHY